jgi:hypothetical protein
VKTSLKELPTSFRQKKLALLKKDLAEGRRTLEQFTAEERDLFHMETSEENVLYWKSENEISKTNERCAHCQLISRNIIAKLRAQEPVIEDTLADDILSLILEKADRLSATH